MAFRRAAGGRALSAPRARQLQPRTRAAASHSALARTAEPCHALPASPLHASPPWHPTAPPPERFWRHAGIGRQPLLRPAPPKPPRLTTWPLAQHELIRSLVL